MYVKNVDLNGLFGVGLGKNSHCNGILGVSTEGLKSTDCLHCSLCDGLLNVKFDDFCP